MTAEIVLTAAVAANATSLTLSDVSNLPTLGTYTVNVEGEVYTVSAVTGKVLSVSSQGNSRAHGQSAVVGIIPTAASTTITASIPPSANNDLTQNFAVGDLWLQTDASGKTLYTAQDVTVSRAVWTKTIPYANPYPVDAAVSAGAPVPVAIYGLTRLYSAYSATGNCIQITRNSDVATLNVPFLNDVVDLGAIAKFLAGTWGRVTTWYDQSGNLNHATQGTFANAPTIRTYKVNGIPVIEFDSAPWNASAQKTLALPAVSTGDQRGSSIFAVVSANSLGTDSFATIAALGATDTPRLMLSSNQGAAALKVYNGLSFAADGGNITSQMSVIGSAYGTNGNCFAWVNGRVTANSALSAGAITGGVIGGLATLTTRPLRGAMQAIIFYSATLTSAQGSVLSQALTLAHNITPQFNKQIIVDGDSISEGVWVTTYSDASLPAIFPGTQDYPSQLSSFLPTKLGIKNIAVSGVTLYARGASTYPATLIGQRLAGTTALIIFAGTNDINNQTFASSAAGTAYGNTIGTSTGAGTDTLPAHFVKYCTANRISGTKIIAVNMLPRNGWDTSVNWRETARLAYNTWLAANWSTYCDGFIDLAASPAFAAGWWNTTYGVGSVDGTHPSLVGYGVIAQVIGNYLSSQPTLIS